MSTSVNTKSIKVTSYIIGPNDATLDMIIPLSDCNIYHYTDDDYFIEKYKDDCLLWEWSGGYIADNHFTSKRLTFIEIYEKKFIFVGSVDGISDFILDYETGKQCDLNTWFFENSSKEEFLIFLNGFIIPENYININHEIIKLYV